MKTPTRLAAVALVSALGLQPAARLHAATTIDATNYFAWGANLGWINWRGDNTNGAVIGEYVCSGYIYAANVGWINLGSGSPTNGIHYQNLSAGDFGVNHDGAGNLRGYAYGANIGWIAFETNGAPAVDLGTGNLSGYVWSANCGWICLSNAMAYVQADTIQQGALAPDGLPIAWLLANFGSTNVDAGADPDHDGMSNQQEYLAGTNPNDSSDSLRITSIVRGGTLPTYVTLQWSSKPTRFYTIQHRTNLDASSTWLDLYAPALGISNGLVDDRNSSDFYRIEVSRPLMP